MTRLTKRQKETLLVILSIIFLLSIGAYAYFTMFAPAKEENEQMKKTVANERDVLFSLQKKMAVKDETNMTSSQPFQHKVPVKPLEDAVLKQIDEAAIKSNSSVQDITFSLGEFVIQDPPEQVENVQQLLTEVYVEADSYTKIEEFIDGIEQMERIFIIDSIRMDVSEEIREQGTDKPLVAVTISFSAFYRPDLVNLKGEAPKMNASHPADKSDPTPFNDGTKTGGTK